MKYLVMFPFVCWGVLCDGSGFAFHKPLVQYGALGLCAILVYFICGQFKTMMKQHKDERCELVKSLQKKDEQFVTILKENIDSRNRLTQRLDDRPCLEKKN